MKKSIPMWRALAALVLGVSYTAISMNIFAKSLLIKQAVAYEADIARLSIER